MQDAEKVIMAQRKTSLAVVQGGCELLLVLLYVQLSLESYWKFFINSIRSKEQVSLPSLHQ